MHTLISECQDDAAVQRVAQVLVGARRSGQPVTSSGLEQALHKEEQAYAVQALVAQALGWFDEGAAYWKSGGASRASPLAHAALPAAGVRHAGASLDELRWHTPALEAEIVLRLGQPVTPARAQQLTHEDAAGLVASMAVAIEIADSRWVEGLSAPAWLRLADQGSHGALLIGEWLPWSDHDWANQVCEVDLDAQPVVAGAGPHSLGDPSWLLPIWLRHATRDGRTVAAGTVVTTGSWVGAIPMRRLPSVVDVQVRFPGLGEIGLRDGVVQARR
ncbi:2-keto-4-pentenoate hydratase [Rhodoferax koreense]|uniref:2-keto-4-pentenoate hydratase n=2 Tax=Rhodoferax koreensis TaxID=1842727 RepID=A0A1P8K0Z7_9BURK|nr:2-keto-4-pentenoate hydratase [Rhodoferax koreense]